MAKALLDLPAKRGRLHALAAGGVLDADELERGLAGAGYRASAPSWLTYLYWNTLIIGVVLVVAGAIFFVAANWSALPGLTRLGIVGGAMVAATIVGGYLGETLAGRAVSLLGALLFGPLVAVYGQIYQTGADNWQLFALWAVVLVAYGVLVRFVGIWVLALVCVHVAVFTWMDQELGFEPYEHWGAAITAGLALMNVAVVAVAEAKIEDARPQSILAHTAALFGLMLVLPFGVLVAVDELPEGGVPGLVVLGLALLVIWLRYRWRRPDLGMLAMFAGVVTVLVSCVFGRILFEGLDAELFGVAFLGLLICAQVWGLTRWLLNWRREHGEAAHEPDPGAGAGSGSGEATR